MEPRPKFMTATPIIVREIADDPLPRPKDIYLDPYVLHDPKYRDHSITGRNLSPRSARTPKAVPDSDPANKDADTHSKTDIVLEKLRKDFPYLNSDEDIVVDTATLRGDKYYNLYFLEQNETRHGEENVVRMMEDRIARAAYFSEKIVPHKNKESPPTPDPQLRTVSQQSSYQRVIVRKEMPRVKAVGKTMRIQFYGTSYDATRKSAENVRKRLNKRVTTFRTKRADAATPANVPKLTLKTLFDNGDPVRLLSLVSPGRIDPGKSRPRVQSQICNKETVSPRKVSGPQPQLSAKSGRRTDSGTAPIESEPEFRRRLISTYAGKKLGRFVGPNSARSIVDMPDVLKTAVDWSLAQTYNKIEVGKMSELAVVHGEDQDQNESAELNRLRDKLFKKFETIESPLSRQKSAASTKRGASKGKARQESVVPTTPSAVIKSCKRLGLAKTCSELLSTKDSAAGEDQPVPDKLLFMMTSDSTRKSANTSEGTRREAFCSRCATRERQQKTASPHTFSNAKHYSGTLNCPAEIRAMKEKVAAAKAEAVRTVLKIRKCTRYMKSSVPDLIGLPADELERRLNEKTGDDSVSEEKNKSAKLSAIRSLIVTNRENMVRLGYNVKVLRRDRTKNKPPLDNKATDLEELFGSQECREKVDAALSKVFHERSRTSDAVVAAAFHSVPKF